MPPLQSIYCYTAQSNYTSTLSEQTGTSPISYMTKVLWKQLKNQINLNHNKNLQYQHNTATFFLHSKVKKKHTNNKCTEKCTILPVQTKHGIIFTIYA